jgi:hypothetical protein
MSFTSIAFIFALWGDRHQRTSLPFLAGFIQVCEPQPPNQTMQQRTPKAFASGLADRLGSSLSMKFHPQPAAMRHKAYPPRRARRR